MYINLISHYFPKQIIKNDYFKKVNGLSEEWILSRTGIKERRKALSDENSNTMAIEAVKLAIDRQPDIIAMTVFGGGYSSGAILLKK